MAIVSFFVCLAFVKFYDWLKIDWLGVEVAKEIRDLGPIWIKNLNIGSKIGRVLWWPFSKFTLFILWAARQGGVIAFFVVSVFTDPFVTTVYLRKGYGKYNGLLKKDWMIFLASTVVSNGYWSIRTFAIMEILGIYGYLVIAGLLIILIIASFVIKNHSVLKIVPLCGSSARL